MRRVGRVYCTFVLVLLASIAPLGRAAAAPPAVGPAFDVTAAVLGETSSNRFAGVACTPDVCLVVWELVRANGAQPSDILGARFRASDGALIDPDGIVIQAGVHAYVSPAVAASDDTFLVVWNGSTTEGDAIRAARVRASDGAVLDSSPITVCGATVGGLRVLDVGSNGAGFLAAWELDQSTELITGSVVRAASIGVSGSVGNACGTALTSTFPVHETPAVAWAGSHYVVAWSSLTAGVRVRRIGADGSTLGLASTVSSEVFDTTKVRIAAGDDALAILYGTADRRIGAAILDLDGRLVGDPLILRSDVRHVSIALTHDGSSFVAVWSEYEDPVTSFAPVYLRRFDEGGALLDAAPIPLAPENGYERVVAASPGDGRTFVAYTDAYNITTDPHTEILLRVVTAEYDGGTGGGAGGGGGGGGGTIPPWTCAASRGASSSGGAAFVLALGIAIALARRRARSSRASGL